MKSASVIFAILALLVGVPAAPSQAESSRGITIPAFYDPPASIPAKPGSVIRSEPTKLAIDLPGILSATATRMMYTTIDSSGKPTPVTGAYLVPKKEWKGEGPRPVVGFAVGTIGQGDQCAPSIGLEKPLQIGLGGAAGSTFTINYDLSQMSFLLGRGYAIALTDYVGMGVTTRLHTYANRLDSGRAVLDAVRASQELGAAKDAPVATYGYSQGGGASGSAAELQPSYAPELKLKGSYVGAPPADLVKTLPGINGNLIFGVAGYAANGFAESYPAVQQLLDRELNDRGRAALKDISTSCVTDILMTQAMGTSAKWTTSGKSLSELIEETPATLKVLQDQHIGRLKPTAPVLVAGNVGDGTVPHGQVRELAQNWCQLGAQVTYAPTGLPAILGDRMAVHHIAGLVESLPRAQMWIADRLSGKESSSNCNSIWRMP